VAIGLLALGRLRISRIVASSADSVPANPVARVVGADAAAPLWARMAVVTTEAAAPARREGSRRLLLSVPALLAVVVVVVLAVPRESGNPSPALDYRAALAHARTVAPFPVLAPVGLPVGWSATSVRTDVRRGTVHWHLQLLTPEGTYASLDQSDRIPAVFVREMTERGGRRGTVTIGGRAWVRTYAWLRNHRALWQVRGVTTTVVGGTAGWRDLETLASSLTAAPSRSASEGRSSASQPLGG
jgi:hypothetical protein